MTDNTNTPQDDTDNTKHDRGLIAWFAYSHVPSNIVMMMLIIGGLIAVFNMTRETFPTLDPKTISISVIYPGATPYEIADSITSRVEENLIGIEGVKRISSTASEGYGRVAVELNDFVNQDDVYNDVETAVNSLSDFPPEDAERPIITKLKLTPNVLTIALHGNVSEDVLKYWAETIEDDMRQLPGIALTNLKGIRDYEISIEISEKTLRKYNLSLQDIGNAVANFSTDIPAGTIEATQGDILLRVQERRYTAQEFESIIIRTREDGSRLYLGDIANIIDGFQDTNLISKFNNERAAFIDISRSASDDTIKVADAAKAYIESVRLPEGLSFSLQNDNTEILVDRINLMLRNSILGFMLVFIILLLFLDLRLAFWTSVAIPVSFLGGLTIIYFLGYSMNMITLFALIVVLGIVVDDAIITGESIFEEQEKDRTSKRAVVKGVKNVIAPVTVGVSTTIAAFAPLIFSTGTLGQIIKFIPIAVIPILLISLLEAYFILPSHLAKPGRWNKGVMADIRRNVSNGLYAFIDKILTPFARFTIAWRYATVTAFIGLLIITVAMFSSGVVRFVFFPQIEGDQVTIDLEMEKGAPFALTREAILRIEKEALKVEEDLAAQSDNSPFRSISTSIGETSREGGPGSTAGTSNANHIGQIKIRLVGSDFRAYSSSEIESMIRDRTKNIPNVASLSFKSSTIGEDADIEIELTHGDEETLNAAARDLKSAIENIEGTVEVDDSFKPGKTEYIFELTPEGYAAGLTPSELGRQIRHAFFGLEAQRFQRGRSEIIAYIHYPKEERESLNQLENTRIRLNDGREVPLSSVANIKEQLGYSEIQTVNGRRIVSVTGDVDYNITTPNDVIRILNNETLPTLQERYTGLSYSFEGESREQSEDLASLGRNMLIASLIIYVLLATQLHSYIQPLIIMSAIPFGVVGAVWGHYLLGHDVSFISLFGIVALTGVVVNDSVVLMDFFNKQMKEGLSTFNALISAIQRRFRPILLTTMTTSLGLLPMLLETSRQAQFLIPMVISLATGIIFATLVILIFIPCLMMILRDIRILPRYTLQKTGLISKIKKQTSIQH